MFRGGLQHRKVGRMPDTDLIHDIRSKGVKYHIFSKTEGKDRALFFLTSIKYKKCGTLEKTLGLPALPGTVYKEFNLPRKISIKCAT
jgi:hypothetical protein